MQVADTMIAESSRQQTWARIARAAAALSQHTSGDGGCTTVIATSKGVQCALDLADSDPEHIKAVVNLHGSGGGEYTSP